MKKKVHILLLMFMLTLITGKIAVNATNGFSVNCKIATVNIGDANRLELELVKNDENWEGVVPDARWTSYNVNIAAVEQDGRKGVVTPLRKGTAIISSGVGFPRETCVVKVVEPGIRLNKTAATLYIEPGKESGQTLNVKATVKGADAKNVVWSSSDDTIASVDVVTVKDPQNRKTCVITAKREGTAVITARANGISAECEITVKQNNLTLNVDKVLVSNKGTGSSVKVVPTIVGPSTKVKWESADKTVATVNGGKITGKATGNTKVTAIANGVSVVCDVEVKEGLLSINEEHVLLYVTGDEGETKQLKTNAAKNETVAWSSDKPEIADVNERGIVTAKKAGIAVISVERQSKDGSNSKDSCIVDVKETSAAIAEDSVALTTKGNAKTYQLDFTVEGRKAAKWTSSNSKVVSVSKGKLTAKKAGAAVITVDSNGVKDTVNVSVREFTPTIRLNQNEYTIYTQGTGNTVTLKATVDGPSKKVTWYSGNSSVATVKNGKVTAVSEGRALITAKANNVTTKCWITVTEPKVILEKNALILQVGDRENLPPMDIVGAKQTVTYSSSNTKVASVSKGVVTAKKEGTAVITVKANNVTATCYVKVGGCEDGKHVYVPITEEDEDNRYGSRKAGCLEGGIDAERCTQCGAIKQEITPPTGHSFGAWEKIVKETENATGLERQVCTNEGCNVENTRTVPAINKGDSAHSYKLVWEDNFDGDSLNRDIWNVELHNPGWVNEELQSYVDSTDNIYVKDGYLTIQAIKSGEGDQATYTSGRINTQGNKDYKYGRFEARVKVPDGKGFLPAFWMMPTDESYYGQWPKCGEIDIMEVHGSAPSTSYSTLHFGEPHTQKQGTYTLSKSAKNFADDFHVFACEWDPNEFRFYVDGQMFYKVNDWFTKREGFGEVAYPAPYDQDFYMILNLAVGGSWVGYPDESTKFEDNAQMVVDYVKVYEKDSYDFDFDKPEDTVELRDPDSTGNYIINGDFAKVEDLKKGDKNWKLLLAEGGDATAKIANKQLDITTTAEGSVNHSVQIVQANLPMEQGSKYKLSFDAWADENRTMVTNITAPDRGYIRYLEDTTVNLTTDKPSQPFEYTFEMTSNSDANGRVEFNLGHQGSTAGVHITNVRLEKVGAAEEEVKSVLPDGNYVYNGQFNEGNDFRKPRMAYWDWNGVSGTKVSVTNDAKRELEVIVPDTASDLKDVVVSQDPIAIKGGKQYVLSFTARADGDKTIQTTVAGETFESSLTAENKEYRYEIDTTQNPDMNGTALKFLLGTPGTIWIDDVSIREDGMIVNGDFSNGMVGFELFVDASASASAMVDELNEDKAVCIDIEDTGDQDWKIQLKQNNVKLEEGKWYNISFDAKSTMDRTIMYALQRDGTNDDVWTPYSGTQKIDLTSGYQKFSTTFKMAGTTDPATILSISMGAVNGKQITTKHTVTIDNIVLVETEPQEEEKPEPGTNMIKNGDFSEGSKNWENSAGDKATVTFDGKAVYDIKDVGTNDYDVQLKQTGLKLEQGASYNVKFKISSTVARTVKYGFLDPTNGYKWYGGEDLSLEEGVTKGVNYDFTVDDPTCVTSSAIEFYISMGKIADVETPLSIIEIDDIELYKTGEGSGEDQPGEDDPVEGEELIKNGDFSKGSESWVDATNRGNAAAEVSFENGKASYEITNVGENDYDVQLKQTGLTLEKGANYRVTFKIKSSEARLVKHGLQDPENGYQWYGGETLELTADETKTVDYPFTVTDKETSDTIDFYISMGQMKHESGDQNGQNIETPVSTIEISDVSIKKLGGGTTDGGEEIKPGTNLIKNGDFSKGSENWEDGTYDPGEASVSFEDGKAVYEITALGDLDQYVQLRQTNLKLEQGASYQVKFKIKSTVERTVKYVLMDPNAGYKWYGGEDSVSVTSEGTQVDATFTISEPTSSTITFAISMGKTAEDTPLSTIEIDDVSVIKLGEEEKTSETVALKPADKPIKEEEPETDENVSDEPQDDDDEDDIAGEDTDEGDDEEQTEDDSEAEDDSEDDSKDGSDSGDKSNNDSESGDNSETEDDQEDEAGDAAEGGDSSVEAGISYEVEADMAE